MAVTEAMALVRDLSTDESPQFVNGVLGALLRDKETLTGLKRRGPCVALRCLPMTRHEARAAATPNEQ